MCIYAGWSQLSTSSWKVTGVNALHITFMLTYLYSVYIAQNLMWLCPVSYISFVQSINFVFGGFSNFIYASVTLIW